MDTAYRTAESTRNCCPACGAEIAVTASGPLHGTPCPQCARSLRFVRKLSGDVVVLTFLPGMKRGSDEDSRWVDEALAALGAAPRCVMNLAYLPFVTSYFLGTLVALQRRLALAHRTMAICGLQPCVAEVLQVTRLERLFTICSDEQTALKTMSPA